MGGIKAVVVVVVVSTSLVVILEHSFGQMMIFWAIETKETRVYSELNPVQADKLFLQVSALQTSGMLGGLDAQGIGNRRRGMSSPDLPSLAQVRFHLLH